MTQVDKDALVEGFAEEMAAGIRRALAGGFDGWVDDVLAFPRPWGVDLRRITSPATVRQGVPGAVAGRPKGYGYVCLLTAYRGQILDELLATSRAPG